MDKLKKNVDYIGSKKFLNKFFIDCDVRSGDVAELMGYDKQVFYNKLSRDTMSFEEVSHILSKFGYELTYRPKE